MVAKYPSYADRVHFIELLAEGGSHSVQAEQSHLESWIGAQSIPFTTLRDPDGVGMRIVQTISSRENSYLVELSTMRIVKRARAPQTVLDAL